MLLAGGERKHIAALALGIDSLTAQAARHHADMFLVAHGKKPKVRPAKLQANADGLSLAHDNICAQFAGSFDSAQSDRFGHDRDQQSALRMSGIGHFFDIGNAAQNIGILNDDTGGVFIDPVNQA